MVDGAVIAVLVSVNITSKDGGRFKIDQLKNGSNNGFIACYIRSYYLIWLILV